MLVKLPSNEDIQRLREAVYSLCEHTADMRYADVNRSIEEIIIQIDSLRNPDTACATTDHSSVNVENSSNEKVAINRADLMRGVCEETKGISSNSNCKKSDKNIQNKIANYSIGGRLRKRKGISGLENIKNTCFMNCILQCLFKTVELADYFLTNNYEKNLKPKKENAEKVEFARSFANLLKQFWNGKNKFLTPIELKNKFRSKNKYFFNDEHQDADEFFFC